MIIIRNYCTEITYQEGAKAEISLVVSDSVGHCSTVRIGKIPFVFLSASF